MVWNVGAASSREIKRSPAAGIPQLFFMATWTFQINKIF
jgi:hypothetical protein